jgi:hypothetical protein
MMRAVIFDVENSSRVEHIARMLEHLGLGTLDRQTRLMAVGNWGVIGYDTARLLARHGAELLHTAPAFGVKDWSDLRIAVTAGIWLAGARPGDVLDIITDDQAFDAVGDVAAGRGVDFHRLSYRALVGARQIIPRESASDGGARRRRTGRRRTRRAAPGGRATESASSAPARSQRRSHGGSPGAAQPAPADEILAVLRELLARGEPVPLDALSSALKARGFSRPPGSPRLVTRLRQMKDIEVSPSGTIRPARKD